MVLLLQPPERADRRRADGTAARAEGSAAGAASEPSARPRAAEAPRRSAGTIFRISDDGARGASAVEECWNALR